MAEHNTLGTAGEKAAALYLAQQGYTLHERNWHDGHYEIDIIAEWHGTLVFVEVKTRATSTYGQPYEAVDADKEARLLRAAWHYRQKMQHHGPWRFDIISLVGMGEPFELTHITHASSSEVVGTRPVTR